MKIAEIREKNIPEIAQEFSSEIIGKYRYDPYVKNEDVIEYFINNTTRAIASGDAIALQIRKNDKILAFAIIQRSDWDSKLIGVKVAKLKVLVKKSIEESPFIKFLNFIHRRALQLGYRLIFSRRRHTRSASVSWARRCV